MRRPITLALCALLLTAACGNKKSESSTKETTSAPAVAVDGAQTYSVSIDWPSEVGQQYLMSAFYPATIRARPGDTIVFENHSSQAIHTVSVGIKPDRTNAPPLVTPKGDQFTAVVAQPCYAEADATPTLATCPAVAGPAQQAAPLPSIYGGKGYWNSGLLPPDIAGAPNPPPPAARVATLGLAPSIAPGSYAYSCLVHAFMNGTIEVVAADADRRSPQAVIDQGRADHDRDVQAAGRFAEPAAETSGKTTTVTASVGDKVVTINKFFPVRISIKAGDTVVWKDGSLYDPHTVTFESPFASPEAPGVFIPGGTKTGSSYSGGFSNSGFFGPKPFFPVQTFSLTFAKSGSYPYVCVLHPGMGGQIDVT